MPIKTGMIAVGAVAWLAVSTLASAADPPPTDAPAAAVQTAASPTDTAFLAKAVPAGREEVAAARTAIKLSKSAAVKKAAEMMSRDHRMANHELAALAAKKGWSLPPRDAAAPTGYTDEAYVTAQVRAHQDAIALFTDEAANGSDADLKAFAQKTLPTLQHHLKALQALPS